MPNYKIQWLNNHTPICDRLEARVQLMEAYFDSKFEDFDSFAV